ncbi:NPCBM/NEW2 domain-containing protein [bacterium]|nr:NPCBM/NEW2 domain-containing protein [bacterium]
MRAIAASSMLAALVLGAVATAGEAPKCALADGLITLKADGDTVTVTKGGKRTTAKGKAGAEVAIDLAKLGLPAGKADQYVGWNHMADTFLPPTASPIKVVLGQGEMQRINIRKLESRPQLVSAMGGCLKVAWDAEKKTLSGIARVPAEKPLHLRITAPPKPQAWQIEAADVAKADWDAGVVPEPWQSGPWAGVVLRSPVARDVAWTVYFKTGEQAGQEGGVSRLVAEPLSHKKVQLRWFGGAGYTVLQRNGMPAIGLFTEEYLDKKVLPKTQYTYTVSALTWAGQAKPVSATITTPEGPPPLPKADVYASSLKPVKATVGWNDTPRMNKSIDDNPIRIAGEEYDKGIGVHALSEIVFDLKPEYERFVSYVGVDDEKGGAGTCTFDVFIDGKKVYSSGRMAANEEPKEINVAIPKGSKQIRLVTGDAGDGIGCDHADWAETGFILIKK